jgi:ERCC4-related helicase
MFRKVFKNLDFIECLVKLAHIKNRLYIQGVAKLSQKENK